MILLAELVPEIEALDRDALLWLTCRLYHPVLDPILLWSQEKVVAIPIVVVALLALSVRRPRCALRAAFACAAGFGLAMILATVLWATVDRERPPATFDHHLTSAEDLANCELHPEALPLRKHAATSRSFPSRHGLTIGVFVAVFWCVGFWYGLGATLYGLVAAVGRVYAAKHWPTDVIVGVMAGALLGWLAWWLTPKVFDLLGHGGWVREPAPDAEEAAG